MSQSRGGVERVGGFQRGHERVAEFAAGIGFAQDLVEARVGIAAALPIQQEIEQDTACAVVIDQPLTGLGEFEHAPGNDRTRHVRDARRQLPRGIDAQRLPQHAIGRVQQLRREGIDEVRHADCVG